MLLHCLAAACKTTYSPISQMNKVISYALTNVCWNLEHFGCDSLCHDYIEKCFSSWKDQLEYLRFLMCNLAVELHENCTLTLSQALFAASWQHSWLITRAYSSYSCSGLNSVSSLACMYCITPLLGA